jgi:hypothetical protein
LILAVDLIEDNGPERYLNVCISLRRTGEQLAAASPHRVEIEKNRFSAGFGQNVFEAGLIMVVGRRARGEGEKADHQGRRSQSRH